MTSTKFAFESLPNWPRLLSQQQAAAYLSVSTGTFASELRAGIWPAPVQMPRPRRKVWDLRVLDAAVDRLSGLSSEEPGHSQDPDYFRRRLEAAYGNPDDGRQGKNYFDERLARHGNGQGPSRKRKGRKT